MNHKICLASFLLLVSACAIPEQTVTERIVTEKPPDLTTYKNLTDLKPEVVMLYETFMQDPVDHEWIWTIRLRMAQAYEYEKGKGEEHKERAGQIQTIRDQFDKDLKQRQESGPWNPTQLAGRIKGIEAAFDTAIMEQRGDEGKGGSKTR